MGYIATFLFGFFIGAGCLAYHADTHSTPNSILKMCIKANMTVQECLK